MKNGILRSIKTQEEYSKFIEYLFLNQDLKYREYMIKILATNIDIIGIRSHLIKEVAKEIFNNDFLSYIKFFEKLSIKKKNLYYEEKLIYSLVVSYMKENFSQKIKRVNRVIDLMDNWSICDSFVSSAKFIKEDKEKFYKFLKGKIYSEKNYEQRFLLVTLLNYYMEKEYIQDIFEICLQINNKEYYVRMAKAWLLSVCYVNFEKETYSFLKTCVLDDWEINKTIQKIRESNRVKEEKKQEILCLKRK